MSMEQFLDNLFTNHANGIKKSLAGKKYRYHLLGTNYETIQKGTCTILDCSYSKSLDCNVYRIKDCETGEVIEQHQFKLDLFEI